MERLGPDSAGILATYTARAEQQLWDLMNSGVSSASTLNLQFDSFVSLARSEAALDRLEALLQNQLQIAGFKPGQSQRWNIIRRFSERNRSNARQWLDSELVLDPSDSGRRAAIAAEAALPDPIVKQAWVERILEQNDPLPLSHLRSAMASLFPPGQEALQLTLLPQLTADLGALAATRDNYYLQFYGTNLFQGVCNAEGLEMLRAAIADRDAVGTTLYKFIGENARQAGLCLAQKQQFGR